MSKQIIIAEQHRIAAVFSEDQIQEIIVATGSHQVGDIYLGVVENVLPGIDAAFVNLGDTEKNGFIHVSDLGPVRLKRSAGAITELLTPQQKVLVQVMKEPTGNKGPRLTGNLSLPGRYLVLMPSGRGVNLSRRIRNEEERNRLRALGILVKPAGMGLLVRTEAEDVPEDAIIEDLEMLQKQWESVQQQASSSRAPSLLDRDDDFVQRVLRDVYSDDVNRIVIDSSPGLKRVKQHLMSWNESRLPQGVLVDQHHEAAPILEYFRVNAAIREALKPRVDLPSGGYIIIERTEALTVVDVNSGSFTRSATARETVLWTNCEAATEIARQLRLRNIAGVIIIDFIDMDSRRDQLQVLEHFNKAIKPDKSRPQIAQLSELGLVELTRKRQGQNIYELFGQPCPTCGGLGHLAHLPGSDPEEVGESVERSAPRRSSRRAAPSLPDVGSSSLDPSKNLQELDLTNHPSYQEQGTRKRRRRARLGDSLSRTSSRMRSGSEKKPPKPAESNGVVLPTKTSPDRSRPSRSETSKKQEEAPPELISITMTAEEQIVYGFMGISPLTLYDGTIKNPKSVTVDVCLPGEEKTPPVKVVSSKDTTDDSTPDAEATPQAESKPRRGRRSKSESPAPPIKVSDAASVTATEVSTVMEADTASLDALMQETVATEVEAEEIKAEVPKADPKRRRRRRSSSAKSAGAKQLSLETDS
ncbi:MAG: Rne/Rng family ribonuclease [Cyanobacteria bacterium P01_A01_bin.17]